MKNKVLGLALIGCLGLTLTGCKGDLDDLNKQVDKMEQIIEDGEIFDEDWSVTVTITSDGDESEKEVILKDGSTIYIKAPDGEMWLVKESGSYKMYRYEVEGDTKEYKVITKEEYDVYANVLETYYNQFFESLNEPQCDEDDVECKVEKTLFGKVTFTQESTKNELTVVLKGGKILSTNAYIEFGKDIETGELYSTTTEFEFDYSDQDAKSFKKADFTLVE